ncbi:hypothetical protein D3C86_1413110 [compost metagenome]
MGAPVDRVEPDQAGREQGSGQGRPEHQGLDVAQGLRALSHVGRVAEAGQGQAKDAGAKAQRDLLAKDRQAEDQGFGAHAAAPLPILHRVRQHGPEADHIGGGADGLHPQGGEQQRQGLAVGCMP